MPDSTVLQDSLGTARTCDVLWWLMANSVPTNLAYFESGTLHCCFANECFAQACGQSVASTLGKTVYELLGQAGWEAIYPYVEACAAGEQLRFCWPLVEPGQTPRMIEVHLVPHREAERQLGAVVVVSDITHHWLAERTVRAEYAAHETEERMRKFSAATEEAIVFHSSGQITDGNEALERLLGRSMNEVRGTRVLDYISPEWHQSVREHFYSGREVPFEFICIHRDGRRIPVESVAKTISVDGKAARVVAARDITARKQAQEHLAYLTLHDALTQLPNRRYLMEELGRVLARAQRSDHGVALLLIDLDHFKTVNNSLGQAAGDALLREMARRLRGSVRQEDMVARLGGDYFAVLLPDLSSTPGVAAQIAVQVADKVLVTVTAPHAIGSTNVSLSASIGVSLYSEQGISGEDLVRHAELAMHHAKNSGGASHQLYMADMASADDGSLDALRLARELREAIAQKAFVLHYQPQVRLSDGSLAGLEALVRWNHPERGLVGPAEFIAFAEDRGLIAQIGQWVLREACRQLKAWHDAGLPRVPVAVNLSAVELRQRDVVADIAEVLDATGLEPHYLEIEITESVLMQQGDHAQSTLAALKALGVGLSIDDFGTGYSSLAYLKRYPIDRLKIDRSFVTDVPHSADDVAIVTAIVQMGRSLHLKTVAEGVETPAQHELLRQLGCDMGQGWGFAKPMDAERAQDWMRSRL